jgi:hypothetical protein
LKCQAADKITSASESTCNFFSTFRKRMIL